MFGYIFSTRFTDGRAIFKSEGISYQSDKMKKQRHPTFHLESYNSGAIGIGSEGVNKNGGFAS